MTGESTIEDETTEETNNKEEAEVDGRTAATTSAKEPDETKEKDVAEKDVSSSLDESSNKDENKRDETAKDAPAKKETAAGAVANAGASIGNIAENGTANTAEGEEEKNDKMNNNATNGAPAAAPKSENHGKEAEGESKKQQPQESSSTTAPATKGTTATGTSTTVTTITPATVDTKKGEDLQDDAFEAFNMSQSERKRYREKKRRQNITAAIDSLSKILVKADPSIFISHNNQLYYSTEYHASVDDSSKSFQSSPLKKRRSDTSSSHSTSNQHQPLNRTEIITHAATTIEKLAKIREEQKAQLLVAGFNPQQAAVNDSSSGGNENNVVAVIAGPPVFTDNGTSATSYVTPATSSNFAITQQTAAPGGVMMAVSTPAGNPTLTSTQQQPQQTPPTTATFYMPAATAAAAFPFPGQQYIMNHGTNPQQGGVFQWQMHPNPQQAAFAARTPSQVGSNTMISTPAPGTTDFTANAPTTNGGTIQTVPNGGIIGASPTAMVGVEQTTGAMGYHGTAPSGHLSGDLNNSVQFTQMNAMTAPPPPPPHHNFEDHDIAPPSAHGEVQNGETCHADVTNTGISDSKNQEKIGTH